VSLQLYHKYREDANLADRRDQKRKQLLLEKQSDPAVLVDIPKTPGADEIEKGQCRSDDGEHLIDSALQDGRYL
jgi:hypothetical protein